MSISGRMAIILAAAAVMGALASCNGGDDNDETPTPTPAPQATPTAGATTVATPTTGATRVATTAGNTPTAGATRAATATGNTPAAGATTATTPVKTVTPPKAEGTVDPLNPGQTTDWRIKGNPDPAQSTATLVEVRVGVHPEQGGWERIVFEFSGTQLPAGVVGYVANPTQCGSGQPLPSVGKAALGIRFTGAQAHNNAGQSTVNVLSFKGPGDTIIGGVQACDFEGRLEWFLGMKGTQNFKVTTLQNPTRLVVDVKQ